MALFSVFKAKRSEMEWVVKRSGLLVEDSADDACIRLRGLPFGCAKDEIAKFFEGKHGYKFHEVKCLPVLLRFFPVQISI